MSMSETVKLAYRAKLTADTTSDSLMLAHATAGYSPDTAIYHLEGAARRVVELAAMIDAALFDGRARR